MTDSRDLINKWTAEYAKGGIPSSVRETPSGAVKWAVKELKGLGFPLRSALDVGCGKGRNSLYLAEQGLHVTAFDFTSNAIEHLQSVAAEHNLTPRIRAMVQDVTEDWPVAEGSMDLVVDAFCFKHIAPHDARMIYRANLLRVLRTRGHYMISFASIGDGYYGQYVVDGQGKDEQLAVDPVIGVESVLYTRDAVVQFFAPELLPFAELQNDKPSVMHGREYKRSTYALLMQRNPHRV
jgi:SAM-dependent methyltransferase